MPEEGGQIETYYYYAKISGRLLDRITSNAIETGFILLEDVRYWGDGDLLHAYRDIESSDELLFRIKHIAKLEIIRVEPKVGLGYEQFEERAVEATVATSSEAAAENDLRLRQIQQWTRRSNPPDKTTRDKGLDKWKLRQAWLN